MKEQNARERILQAAIKVFAEKSFEGSRIDEISREANVPKSLIYYHFKSKDEILEVLTSKFIGEYTNIIETRPNETHSEKAKELAGRMQNDYYEFGQKNADLVRLLFIDSLKKSTETPVFYRILDMLIKKDSENNLQNDYDVEERRIAEFFTSFIPTYAYLCFADSWTRYFDIDRKKFDEIFLRVYGETHGAYHNNHK
jgi:AcrR family transcriptional regulator